MKEHGIKSLLANAIKILITHAAFIIYIEVINNEKFSLFYLGSEKGGFNSILGLHKLLIDC